MERRLSVILAADVVGYSGLMAADEERTLSGVLALRRDVIEPRISAHRGRLFKVMGDGFLYEFSSVVDAVNCAVSIQKQIAADNDSADDQHTLRLRIGINLGDVVVQDGDLYGDGVNIAARLEAEADPGGILLSNDAFRHVRGKTQHSFSDVGEKQFKNIPEAVRVYKVDLTGLVPQPCAFETLTGKQPDLPDKPSVAVLPFENKSADASQDYFADGISEGVIAELGRFPNLFVVARNSTFAFRGTAFDLRDVSKELGARFIVEGSVRRLGNRVRVSAQLIDAISGKHRWAERYDRDLDDIFAVQDEITRNVAASVAPQIEVAEIEQVRGRDTQNVSAYDMALKAAALYDDALVMGRPDLLEEAIATADRSLSIDPRSVLALLIQAKALGYMFLFRWGKAPDDALHQAKEKIDRLFEIDRSDPRAYSQRGMIHYFMGQHDAALADARRAIELNPSFAYGYFLLAWMASLYGLADEALEHVSVGLRLSPRESESNLAVAYLALAQASFAKADYAETQKWARLAIQLHPRAPIRRALMIASCVLTGDLEEADAQRDSLESFAPDFLASVIREEVQLYHTHGENQRLRDALASVPGAL